MSNDMRPNLTNSNLANYVNTQGANHSLGSGEKKHIEPFDEKNRESKYETESNSMDILSGWGSAKVNMDNGQNSASNKGIKNSMEQFKQNPQLIENYIYFCDNLVKEGKSLENAIDCTDKVFAALKDENLYH